MTARAIPPAPEWYRLEVPEGLDGFDRFMYGPAPKLPPVVLAFAYRIGVMPGSPVRATRSSWQLPIYRAEPGKVGPRSAYAINVPYGIEGMCEAGRAHLEQLAEITIAEAGEPARVRDLLGSREYLTGHAAIRYVELGRGWCLARIDRFGRRMVRVEVAGDENREPVDLDALAELVPLVEPRSEVVERWRERGDS